MKKDSKNIDSDGNSVKEKKSAKKSAKKPAKKRASARIKKMALKYEAAWKVIYNESNGWKRTMLREEPDGRHAKELYHAVVALAESEGFEPVRAIYAGDTEGKELEPPMLSGTAFGNN